MCVCMRVTHVSVHTLATWQVCACERVHAKCVCVCAHTIQYARVFIFMHMHVSAYLCVSASVWVCLGTCISICENVCMRRYAHVKVGTNNVWMCTQDWTGEHEYVWACACVRVYYAYAQGNLCVNTHTYLCACVWMCSHMRVWVRAHMRVCVCV